METRLKYNCAHLRSTRESLTFEYDIWWYWVSRRQYWLGRTNKQTNEQGKIELLSRWTMDGWDEQYERNLFLARRKVGDSGTGIIMARKGTGSSAATMASWGGNLQTLFATFTLWTSLMDVWERSYRMSRDVPTGGPRTLQQDVLQSFSFTFST